MWNLHSTMQKSLVAFISSRSTLVRKNRAGGAFLRDLSIKATPETQYILRYEYVPEVLEKRDPHREEHLKLAREKAVLGGPTTPLGSTIPSGAYFTFASADAANEFAKLDPYVSAGLVTDYVVEEWTIAVKN